MIGFVSDIVIASGIVAKFRKVVGRYIESPNTFHFYARFFVSRDSDRHWLSQTFRRLGDDTILPDLDYRTDCISRSLGQILF